MYEMKDRKVVVVGGGKVATRKVKTLLAYHPQITCISKVFDEELLAIKEVVCITEILKHHELNTVYFEDVDIVIIATDNLYLNEAIYKYCKENRILAMTVDHKNPSDFSFMATKSKKGLVLAASTQGGSPIFSSEIIETFMNSIDDETFLRLQMMREERNLMLKLKKKN